TRLVDVTAQHLVPAFGEFINAILPSAIAGLDQLASFLEGGGATEAVNTTLKLARDLAPAIQRAAEVTGTIVKASVDLFRSLPPELQGLLVGGLALNKLTGGLVTNVAGGLIEAIVSKITQRGSTPAPPLFVAAVTGGLP